MDFLKKISRSNDPESLEELLQLCGSDEMMRDTHRGLPYVFEGYQLSVENKNPVMERKFAALLKFFVDEIFEKTQFERKFSKENESGLVCSFCNTFAKKGHVVAGPEVAICRNCVSLASNALSDDG